MGALDKIVLEVADPAAAGVFYKALGVEEYVDVRATTDSSSGFRGFTLSLICSQPADVDAFLDAALAAGATAIKPAAKSFWGYGGVVQAPDGTIWKAATSTKKNSGPAAQKFDELALLLGVEDVKATKQFYVEHGLGVAKSFGSKYVEFDAAPVKLALYGRKALAKDAGVSPEGSGSHCVVMTGELGSFTDRDGFVWEAV